MKRVTGENLLSLELLSFDTNLFGVRCGKVSFGVSELSSEGISDTTKKAEREQYRHLVAKIPVEWTHASNLLENAGFRLIVESVELKKEVSGSGALSRDVFVYKTGQNSRLVELTGEAFSSGTRFHLDSIFPAEKSTELHERWIISLIEDQNIKILAHRSEGIITGYITINCQGSELNKGHIGLFAVDKKHSRRGIGTLLLKSIESLDEPHLTTLWATTEGNNIQALKTYFGNGFKIIKRWNVFHWRRQ